MPEIWAGELGEYRAASTADGGTALTTTAGYTALPIKTNHLFITPRNFAGSVVAKVSLNPWLVVLKTTDGMATIPEDFSEAMQDGSSGTTIDLALNTLANGHFLLVGSHLPFRGVYVNMTSTVNGTGSLLTVSRWDASWVDSGDTDGTMSGGTTAFAVDGLVYWTVASTWKKEKLSNIYTNMKDSGGFVYGDIPMYWTRWEVDTLCDTATAQAMLAANRSTSYGELLPGQLLEQKIHHGPGGIGCVEALTNAGTANLIINVATVREGRNA